MLTCERCKVHVAGAPQLCPLCQGPLSGVPEEEGCVFPLVAPSPHFRRIFIRLAAFLTLVAAAICVTINLFFPQRGWWSLFVLAGLGSLWLSFAFVIKKRGNLPKNILWQVGLISLLAVVWDLCTGFLGWSLDYVLPVLYTCSMLGMAVVARIMRLHIQDYIIYLVIDSIFGVMPLIFFLCGLLHVVYPSIVCLITSIVSLSALFLFEGRALRAELYRRTHL